jgi:hypothetical protein
MVVVVYLTHLAVSAASDRGIESHLEPEGTAYEDAPVRNISRYSNKRQP